MTQIYMKDTRKGCLDLSKAGELGITSPTKSSNVTRGSIQKLFN